MNILPNYQMMVMMITNAEKVRVRQEREQKIQQQRTSNNRWASSQCVFEIGSIETKKEEKKK